MASKHRILKEDRELRVAIKRYRHKLHQREIKRQKAKSQKEKERALKKQRYLRSAKHLNGKWYDSEQNIYFIFKGKELYIQEKGPKGSHKIIGRYFIKGNKLNYHINKIVRINSKGIKHLRKVDITRSYNIISISKKGITLELSQNETYHLKRR